MAVDLDPVLDVLGEIQFPQDGPQNGLGDDGWWRGGERVRRVGGHDCLQEEF